MSKSNISVGTKGWAERINASWRRSAASFIETGQLLIECKKAVGFGAWKNMLATELDFEERAAQRLMAIAGDARITNPAILSVLPPSYTTLYDLTKLSDDDFDRALRVATINPTMRGQDVPKKRKETPQGAVALDEGGGAPLTGAELCTPQDVREGEDSGVTYAQQPLRVEADRSSSGEDAGIAAESRSGNPETWVRVPPDSAPTVAPWVKRAAAVAVYVDPNDPMSRFATGLWMMIAASQELSPREAAAKFPQEMPLRADELSQFTTWLLDFEEAFGEQPALAPG